MNMEFQHFHDFYELFFLVDDHASHIIEGEYFSLQRYDLVLLKPSLLHMTMYPKGENPKSRLIVAFRIPLEVRAWSDNSELFTVFDEQPPIFRFPLEVQAKVVELLNSIYILGSELRVGYELMVHSKFLELLWLLFTHRKANTYAKQEITDSITQKIYEVTSYLHTHFQEELSLQLVADYFTVSSFYLSHQFKRVTGLNFVNYLQQIRVKNAQQLLLYSPLKIKDICEQCGFSSFSQFNRVFSKFCSVTPSAFRKNSDHRSEQMLRSLDPERNTDATPSKALQSEDEYRAVKKKELLTKETVR
jgi:AraC-like DNA-binding protein